MAATGYKVCDKRAVGGNVDKFCEQHPDFHKVLKATPSCVKSYTGQVEGRSCFPLYFFTATSRSNYQIYKGGGDPFCFVLKL